MILLNERTDNRIDRIHRPTPREFYLKYVRTNRPVVITGIADDWQAIGKWTPEFFLLTTSRGEGGLHGWEDEGLTNDPTEYYRNRKRRTTTLGAFIEAMNSPQTKLAGLCFAVSDLQRAAAVER